MAEREPIAHNGEPTGGTPPAAPARAEPAAREVPANLLAIVAAPRFAIPLLLALGIALYLVNLSGYPLYTKGEPREAVTVFDIVHGGGVILPMRAGVEIPSKPLLMHWIAALASLAAGGVSEFTVRLPSALFAIAGILVCYVYVRKLFDETAALIAALMLGTTFQYLQAGTGARVDMTLTFFLEAAFFEFIAIAEGLSQRRMLLYVAIALALLAKGPVGLALPVLVAAAWIVTERRWGLIRRLGLVRGAIVVAVIGGGWYAAAAWTGGADFVRKQLVAENLVRFFGSPSFHEGHEHAFIYVELALLGGFMPWTFMMAIMALQASRRPLRLNPRITYIVTWFLVVLVFFNLARSKRGVYLLALYPALATMLAVYVADAIPRPDAIRRWISALSAATEAVLVALGVGGLVALATLVAAPAATRELMKLLGVAAPGFAPWLASMVRRQWIAAVGLPIVCEALGLYLARRPASLRRIVAVTAGAAACVTLAANLIVVPAIANTLTLKSFTREAMSEIGSGRVGYLYALNYDVAFYSGENIPIVKLHDRDLPQYLICWRAIYDSLPAQQRARLSVVLTSNPVSLDGADTMVLLRRGGAGGPPKPPSDAVETRLGEPRGYESAARRISAIALTSRGSTTAEPPRKLKSQ